MVNRFALTALGLSLISTTVFAQSHEPPSATNLHASDGYATVYFAISLPGWGGLIEKFSPSVEVFVDGDPIGILKDNECAVARVEAGWHDVYPSEWFHFESGSTYLLRTERGLRDWVLDGPASIDTLDCIPTALNPADRQKLEGARWLKKYANRREKSWASFEKFAKKAGVSLTEFLPLQAKESQYLVGPEKKPFKRLALTHGRLMVTVDGIEWVKGKNTVTINATEILSVSTSFAHLAKIPFVHVVYGDPANPSHAHFNGRLKRSFLDTSITPHHYEFNLIFTAIAQAHKSASR